MMTLKTSPAACRRSKTVQSLLVLTIVLLVGGNSCKAQPQPTPGNILRILTFGDSLAEGFWGKNKPRHAYTIELSEQLKRYYAGTGV